MPDIFSLRIEYPMYHHIENSKKNVLKEKIVLIRGLKIFAVKDNHSSNRMIPTATECINKRTERLTGFQIAMFESHYVGSKLISESIFRRL